ncbi:MAG TPA: hypothetical protein DCE44_21535 [Verrucomicrobiales bacterium]|nr:hypothetical protein [Verrucomicrobiales bacterium]
MVRACRWTRTFPVFFAALLLWAGLMPVAAEPRWRLVWNDEFDQPDGSAPVASRWTYDIGGHGWGNGELQSYTARRENSRIEDGHLVIESRAESFTGSDGLRKDYTSARLKTLGRASWTFGRIEVRTKIPYGQGLWPAFWMLGTDFPTVGWPNCGEVDIMENVGREPSKSHGVLHGPGYSGSANVGSTFTLSGGRRLADDFHVYAIEWERDRVRWFVDDRLFFTATPASLPAGRSWVFNHNFFLILNVAVGGAFPGSPDRTTVFPQRMLVDYVRVYTADSSPRSLQIESGDSAPQLVWPTTLPRPEIEFRDSLGAAWSVITPVEHVRGLDSVAPVPPGYYWLRW